METSLFVIIFTYSFNNYFLSIYYVTSTILDISYIPVKQTPPLLPTSPPPKKQKQKPCAL